jgi:hypothetical protein
MMLKNNNFLQIEDQEEDSKLNDIFKDELKWYNERKSNVEEEVLSLTSSREDFSTCK